MRPPDALSRLYETINLMTNEIAGDKEFCVEEVKKEQAIDSFISDAVRYKKGEIHHLEISRRDRIRKIAER